MRAPNLPPEVGRRLEQRLALLFLAGGARSPNPGQEVGRRLEQRLALLFLAGGGRSQNNEISFSREARRIFFSRIEKIRRPTRLLKFF